MKPCWEPDEHTYLSDGFMQSPGKGGGVSEMLSLSPVIPCSLKWRENAQEEVRASGESERASS